MNSVTCTVAVPPSTSTADRPTGVKLRQAVAACADREEQRQQTAKPRARGQQMQHLRYDQRGANAAAECTGMAQYGLDRESERGKDHGDGSPRAPRPEQGQHDEQHDTSRQQPSPELCPQRDYRHGVQRHRDAAGAGDHRALHHQPYHADDQGRCPTDTRETQQQPSQMRCLG
jgi:hypothetical protein